MSSVTETAVEMEVTNREWQAGVLGGLVGGALMGLILSFWMTPVIENAIPALWGLSGGIAGWGIHMANSAILGVVFAAIAKALPQYSSTVGQSTALGAVYGVVLWVVLAALVMPVWLSAVGFAGAPAFPNFNPMSLVVHLVYGIALGATYPLILNR
jgi:ABC-type Co2+ transport system permease subunit